MTRRSYWWDQQTSRKRRKHYAVQVSAELHERIRAEAERRGLSMQRLVDEAIRAAVPEVRR